MVDFPCLISKVNSCLFSSFCINNTILPIDGSHKRKFRLAPMKGSFKDPCWLPHGLDDQRLLSLLPGNHRWEEFLASSVPVNKRAQLPWVARLAFPSEKFSLHNHYQQISKCSQISRSHLSQMMRQGAVCQKENIMLFSVLTAKNNFKGAFFNFLF